MNSDTDEALKIWKALKPMIAELTEQKTRSCVRAKKMSVTTAPAGGLIGVAEPFGEEVMIPYSSLLANAQVGDAVWVWYYFNNASTMIAMTTGAGQLSFGGQPEEQQIEVTAQNTSVNSSWTNSGGSISSGPYTGSTTLSFTVSGVPAGSTVVSVMFYATFGSPYTGADLLTANGTNIDIGDESLSLTPTEDGNGTYTVEVRFKANGLPGLSDGNHSATVSITSPRVVVTYIAPV